MITEVSDMPIAHQVLTCKTCKKTFSIAKPYDFVEHVNECMKNEEKAIEEIEESEDIIDLTIHSLSTLGL